MTDQPTSADAGGRPLSRAKSGWRNRFTEHLANCLNVEQAARRAKVSVSRAYRTRRTDSDFARCWQAALNRGYENLEMEILRRLREGDLIGQDGSKYDFTNAIRLLGMHRTNALDAETARHAVSASEIRASIDRKIEDIRTRVKAETDRREHDE